MEYGRCRFSRLGFLLLVRVKTLKLTGENPFDCVDTDQMLYFVSTKHVACLNVEDSRTRVQLSSPPPLKAIKMAFSFPHKHDCLTFQEMSRRKNEAPNMRNKKLTILFCLAYLAFSLTGHSSELLSQKTWLSAENGRSSSLFSSFKKEEIKQFMPSGRDPTEKTIKDYQITIYHPVYYSNEENPDTSKDKPASVTVSYKGENQFVGKGYKFLLIEKPKTEYEPLFIIRYWSGTMGCSFTDISFHPEKEPLIERRSSRSVTDTNPLGDSC